MVDRRPNRQTISLRELFPDAEFLGTDDLQVRTFCTLGAACQTGDLFVALVDDESDGHAQARLAQARGAIGMLVERPVPGCSLPVCYVTDTREAHARLCQALVEHPSQQLKVIAVAGGKGRKATARLVASVLDVTGAEVGTLDFQGFSAGEHAEPLRTSRLTAPLVANYLARMVRAGCSHAVIEVSGNDLARRVYCGVQFDMALVVDAHEPHAGQDSAWRVFDYLAPEGCAVLNVDDPTARSQLATLSGPVLSVGLTQPAELSAVVLESYLGEQTFLLSLDQESVPVCTKLPGRESVQYCLSAAAVGVACGLGITDVAIALERVQRVVGDLQRIDCGQPFGVYVDHVDCVQALAESIARLRRYQSDGRLLLVCERYADSATAGELTRVLAEADLAVVTQRDAADESLLRRAVSLSASDTLLLVPRRETALRWVLSEARPGDCLLVAGRLNQSIFPLDEESSRDDRAIVRDCLYRAYATEKVFRASA